MPPPATPATFRRPAQLLIVTLTVTVFAVVVAFVTLQLRASLQEQVLRREGEALAAVASMQLANNAAELAKVGVTDVPGELADVALKTSRLRGVFGIRVFDASRALIEAVPFAWTEEPPVAADWTQLAAGAPIARLRRGPGPALAVLVRDSSLPLLEAWVPLERASTHAFAGAAQFWIDGRTIAAELAALDRRLAVQAGLAWLAGAAVIALALAWAFRRLAAANDALRLRSDDLARANRELVLAAKTSALGAVTAHLIHEIKNPLAGLEVFVANQADGSQRDDAGAELAAASELTRRLRTMINDVVAVLRDEQHGASFELTAAEVCELALARARPAAAARGIVLDCDRSPAVSLAGRRANLACLVLHNLLQNALEASPAGGRVRLAAVAEKKAGDALAFLVEDSGAGLPDAVRARLFQPCPSGKPGGSGLGLALSAQLAAQAGGRLELVRSDSSGTCFRLVLSVGG